MKKGRLADGNSHGDNFRGILKLTCHRADRIKIADVARTELTVLIKRPLDEVWDLINDMERYSVAWGEHYTVTSSGPLGLGSTLSEDDGETARVTEYRPKRAFSIDIDTRGHWAMRSARLGHVLEPVPEGTRFITWFEADFTFMGRLLQPILVASYRRAIRKPVDGLRRYLEEGPPAGF